MESSRDRCVARRRAYALLGALLVEGLDAARLRAVAELPPLSQWLPSAPDLDELAAEHYALFGYELFPYAGVFLGEGGLVGGVAVTDVVRQAYAALGLGCPDDPSPDHLGQMLRLMAVLLDAELDAAAHDATADIRVVQAWQRRVLDQALLPWMPPLYAASVDQPRSLWTATVEMAVAVAGDHRADLPSLGVASTDDNEAPIEGSADALDFDALLADRRTGLRTLASALVTPRRSGVYLARRDIEGIAQRSDVPRGFGGRCDMLERVLRSAAEYGALPRVTEQLQALLTQRDQALATLSAQRGLAAQIAPWRARVRATQDMLGKVATAAQALAEGSVPAAGVVC